MRYKPRSQTSDDYAALPSGRTVISNKGAHDATRAHEVHGEQGKGAETFAAQLPLSKTPRLRNIQPSNRHHGRLLTLPASLLLLLLLLTLLTLLLLPVAAS